MPRNVDPAASDARNAGFYCHPLRPTQPLEVEYKRILRCIPIVVALCLPASSCYLLMCLATCFAELRMFLYDYRQWNDKSLSVELRDELS